MEWEGEGSIGHQYLPQESCTVLMLREVYYIDPGVSLFILRIFSYWRRVSSVVDHSFTSLKVPGLIPGPVSYWGHGL